MTDTELYGKCVQRQSNVDLREAVQTEIDALSTEIGTELGMRGVEAVELGEYCPKLLVIDRKTLDKTLLVQAGVPIETIEACTKVTLVQQLRVDRRKPKS